MVFEGFGRRPDDEAPGGAVLNHNVVDLPGRIEDSVGHNCVDGKGLDTGVGKHIAVEADRPSVWGSSRVDLCLISAPLYCHCVEAASSSLHEPAKKSACGEDKCVLVI